MLIDKFFDPSTPGVIKLLDLTWRRNQAISANIANADTPGYRAVDLNFSSELQRAFGEQGDALYKTSPKHMDLGDLKPAHLIPDLSGATKADGNNVDIDVQMGRLAFNSEKYASASNMLRKQLSMLKNAIRSAR